MVGHSLFWCHITGGIALLQLICEYKTSLMQTQMMIEERGDRIIIMCTYDGKKWDGKTKYMIDSREKRYINAHIATL